LSARDFLGRLIGFLDQAGVPYMIAGSFASTYHGPPRATQDADLVIDPRPESLEMLLRLVTGAGLYVPDRVAREALRQRGQFNVVDPATGWKADLIVRKDRPFSREEFARRASVRVLDIEVSMASAEDTILSKLEWARRYGSERQFQDAVGVIRVSGPALDLNYLGRWAAELDVTDLLRDATDAASRGES
jgi:hypothetical protein